MMEMRRQSVAAILLLLSLSVLYNSKPCLASSIVRTGSQPNAIETESQDAESTTTKPCGFACRGRQNCVEAGKRCDGHKDCPEGDDEEKCPMDAPQPCSSQQFKCKSDGLCLSRWWRCDGTKDCDDGSDEDNCPKKNDTMADKKVTCNENEFLCHSLPLCIPNSWVCDNVVDCFGSDGSDEKNCDKNTVKSTEDMFQAKNKDLSKEKNGEEVKDDCEEESFACKSDGHCFPRRFQCDGTVDCHDGSDEEGCHPNKKKQECSVEKHKFLCKDGWTCLDADRMCDGQIDCPDNSDELQSCNVKCHNKECQHRCVQIETESVCVCNKGYRQLSNGSCVDINECEEFGKCSQLCRNTPGGHECDCVEGYIKAEDGRSCLPVEPLTSLIFSTLNEIRVLHMGPGAKVEDIVATKLNFSGTEQVVGLGFEPMGHRVYWTSNELGKEGIRYASLHFEDKTHFLLQDKDIKSPEGLAYDHYGRNLYFTHISPDTSNSFVGVVSVDSGNWKKLIINQVEKPRGVAVYPEKGLLFYTEWGAMEPGIVRANMDGSNPTRIVKQDITWANGVTVDKVLDRIFWTEAKHDRIESSKLDGTDRRLIVEGVSHPFFISVFGDSLYWSDWWSQKIFSCDKFTGRQLKTLYKEPGQSAPTGVTVFNPSMFPLHGNPCLSALCTDLCLPTPTGHSCACRTGHELDVDHSSCLEEAPLARSFNEVQTNEVEPNTVTPEKPTTTTLNTTTTSTITTTTNSSPAKQPPQQGDNCSSSPCVGGICQNKQGSYSCTCGKGFSLDVDQVTCVRVPSRDLDTTTEAPHTTEISVHITREEIGGPCLTALCSDFCEPTKNGYICFCQKGRILDSDGITCKEKSVAPEQMSTVPEPVKSSSGSETGFHWLWSILIFVFIVATLILCALLLTCVKRQVRRRTTRNNNISFTALQAAHAAAKATPEKRKGRGDQMDSTDGEAVLTSTSLSTPAKNLAQGVGETSASNSEELVGVMVGDYVSFSDKAHLLE